MGSVTLLTKPKFWQLYRLIFVLITFFRVMLRLGLNKRGEYLFVNVLYWQHCIFLIETL